MTDYFVEMIQMFLRATGAHAVIENPERSALWDTICDGSPWREVRDRGQVSGKRGGRARASITHSIVLFAPQVIDHAIWVYQLLLSYCFFATSRHKRERFVFTWNLFELCPWRTPKGIPPLAERLCRGGSNATCPGCNANGTHKK